MMNVKCFKIDFLIEKIIELLLRVFFLVVRPVEKLLIKKYSKGVVKYQPVFIIGAPRTGSTILYQVLTNVADVLYIDNLAHRFYRNLFFGIWLSRKVFGIKPHNNFKADHGRTTKYGMHAPSECGDFWYRWLPLDQHFIAEDDICEKVVSEIRDEILAISNYHMRPIVFKNLNAGQRLRLLKRAFPNAKFIFIKRDSIFTVNSIINARVKNNIATGEWWSIKPKNYRDLLQLDEVDMCMAQVFYLERQIKDDLQILYSNNFKELNFAHLSNDIVNELIGWLKFDAKVGQLPEFVKDDIRSIERMRQIILREASSKYEF
ncbi:sulfotransferase [Endozoicomonas sp. Mp262]|uniref:sulfotransferase n=1 Tax=Endozoicomonas sp. Mp262 TaxID=2919499 RepID=UPI0021D9619D